MRATFQSSRKQNHQPGDGAHTLGWALTGAHTSWGNRVRILKPYAVIMRALRSSELWVWRNGDCTIHCGTVHPEDRESMREKDLGFHASIVIVFTVEIAEN